LILSSLIPRPLAAGSFISEISMWRKVKITLACWGTVVAFAIIFSTSLVLFGLNDKIEMFFYLHFSAGAIFIFFIFWPFYSKRMK